MPYNVLMPQLGLTMTEGSVSSWLKTPGELVQKGEMLFTVETDKVEMEVESPVAGYMGAILLEPKKTVPTGTLIAVIVDKLDEIPALNAGVETVQGGISGGADAAPSIASVPESRSEARKSKADGTDGFPASPRARRLADQLGIDVRQLKPARGTRIVEEDVKRFHARQLEDSNRQTTGATATETDSSRARLVVADRMAKSFQTAPHFYLGAQINATELVKFRESFAAGPDQASIRLTYTDLFVKALAQTLYEQPGVNSFWADGRIVNRTSVDIAFAVQAGETLLVPVIRDAATLELFELARRRYQLTETARLGKLTLAEMEGGSATLSNLGMFGIEWCQAIINPPQSIIVAVGQIAKRPMVINDRVEACYSVNLTLSADHRVLDGVAGAKFLGRMKALIEYPPRLLL